MTEATLYKRKWAFIIPVAIGIAVALLVKVLIPTVKQAGIQPYVKPVSVLRIQPFNITPRISSFAYVRPAKTWDAVAEVSGKIIYRHPNLEKGAVFKAGEVVIRIDPADYELNLSVSLANYEVAKQQLKESQVKKDNLEKSLKIEQESLELSNAEFARLENLYEKKAVGKSDLDAQKIRTLLQRQKTQNLENDLSLQLVQIGLLDAQVAKSESEVQLNEKNLARTEIQVPYDCRISEVMIDEEQFVSVGEKLAKADDISAVEIEMQVLPQHLEQLARVMKITRPIEIQPESFELMREQYGLEGRVVLTRDGRTITWPAKFMRISNQLDPKTHTLGVFFEVYNPYANVTPGVRPPLTRGTFVEIFFYTRPLENAIAIPRVALRENDTVYLSKDDKVEIRTVKVGLCQPGFVTIDEGLSKDELLITSQVSYIVNDMPVMPIEDQALAKEFQQIVAF